MAEDKVKKPRKCGTCGEVGHTKRTCKLDEPPKKTYNYFEYVYAIETEEDNGDSVDKFTTLFKSVDGLMGNLKKIYESYVELYGDEECTDPGELRRGAFIREDCESFKDVPFPTKETVQKIIDNKYDNLLLKIGEIGGAAGFACKISVRKLKVYE